MTRDSRIFVAGHTGLVGSALVRRLHAKGHTHLLTATRADLDLRDRTAVESWCLHHRPQYVFMAAGTVGGIHANLIRPAEFFFDNVTMQTSVLHAAYRAGVDKVLMLSSGCVYPRACPQPAREDFLLTGALEPSNEPFAVAKLAGLTMAKAYRTQYGQSVISVIPANLYGPYDNFDEDSAHVVPALIRRFHAAKTTHQPVVTCWGSGRPVRDFLHVDDLADVCLQLMDTYDDERPINVGTGTEVTIGDLISAVQRVVYPDAQVHFDASRPDGCPRRVLDVTRVKAMGWRPAHTLETGLASTYQWFLEHGGA